MEALEPMLHLPTLPGPLRTLTTPRITSTNIQTSTRSAYLAAARKPSDDAVRCGIARKTIAFDGRCNRISGLATPIKCGVVTYLLLFSRKRYFGVRRFEYILPIGTWLTVVGEAVKDGSGNVRIQKPDQGPFYISPKPLDQLIPSLGKWSRIFKYASMVASLGLTVCGECTRDSCPEKLSQKANRCILMYERALIPNQLVFVSELLMHLQILATRCGHMCCCLTCSEVAREALSSLRKPVVVRRFTAFEDQEKHTQWDKLD
ncbi:hypothetical protein Bca52824_080184 [Brassica carinata]|uniref:RING-type E3 ubiquitin transferase n=1 Tax=Brassica carinata TaxID=52824 RepID=A0A8X7Q1H8_BRACI|nr:hypothetical protein Bca52824_080184 [Brassica carinata]